MPTSSGALAPTHCSSGFAHGLASAQDSPEETHGSQRQTPVPPAPGAQISPGPHVGRSTSQGAPDAFSQTSRPGSRGSRGGRGSWLSQPRGSLQSSGMPLSGGPGVQPPPPPLAQLQPHSSGDPSNVPCSQYGLSEKPAPRRESTHK